MKAAIAKGEDVNSRDGKGDTALVVLEGHNAIVKLLLETPGIDVNKKTALKDWTALHTATLRGNIEAVRLLLATKFVNVNSKDGKGFTALHMAALKNEVAIVEQILADDAAAFLG